MTTPGEQADSAKVAVAIPCLNEANAIAAVVAAWREALPEAEVIIFDNGSTDGTGDLARGLGVRVVEVPDRGKGNAVRAIFRELAGRPAVVMTDGDGTYPASAVRPLLGPILDGRADMTVGARRPVAEDKAMSATHALGNFAITAAFGLLVGPGCRDLLSGYRAFGPRFLRAVQPRSTGFEIEAELSGEAVGRGFRVAEVPVSYHPRIAGTASKLRAARDGLRIMATIIRQGVRHRPWRLMLALAVPIAAAGLALRLPPVLLAAATLAVAAVVPFARATTRPG
ncbi:glycosyltransferase [Tundrisphaera sp. TA3]|uniref:glycosyltransferase n=1 Tax=Tundrisphaera sp. TA3 TaxID=3435775 RepID=UPI003EBDFA09